MANLTSFDGGGISSDEAEEMRQILLQRYPATFEMCRNVNLLAHRFRNAIHLDYENPLHLIAVCLLQRALDSFQSVTQLMMFGLEADSNSIARSSIEAMLQVRKLCTDKSYLDKYIGADQIRRRRLLNVAKSNPTSILGSILKRPELDSVLAEVTDDIERLGLSESSIKSIAHDVGLDAWYDLNYRVLSEEVHAGPRSLERYLVRDKNGTVSMFDFRPRSERVVPVLVSQASILLIVLDSVEKVFRTGFEAEIDSLFRYLKGFQEK